MAKNEVKCSCGAITRFALSADFRVGGTGGAWKLILGELAEVGESMIPLDIYVCPSCGKIELFAGEEIKSTLLRLAEKER